MNLAKLHQKLALKALDPDNPDNKRIAETIGFRRNGEFVSFKDEYNRMVEPIKVEYKKKKNAKSKK